MRGSQEMAPDSEQVVDGTVNRRESLHGLTDLNRRIWRSRCRAG